MSTPGQHVVIAGAGIIGLATALELACAGYQVTVLERGHAMEQSSWAAAGMLAVHDPENPPGLLPLSLLSASLYQQFLSRVEALSGCTVPLRTRHTLQGVRAGSAVQQPEQRPLALPELQAGRYTFTQTDEASLDPRDLCAALPRAVVAAGVTLREHTAVASISQTTHGITVQLENGDSLSADHSMLTGGAWSGQLTALPVTPRKGQMIEVTLDQADLPMVVRTPELYLVPRGDGRIVIGATVEYAGFDRSIDEAAGDRLWQAAAELWPPVRNGRITNRWTGLRPGFQADLDADFATPLPVIGRLDRNLWIATGHFRNGILLAPATARVLCELLQQKATSVDLTSFSPGRFTNKDAQVCA